MWHVWITNISVTGSGPTATISIDWGQIYPGSIEVVGPMGTNIIPLQGTGGTVDIPNQPAGKYKARAHCNSPGHTDGPSPWSEFEVP